MHIKDYISFKYKGEKPKSRHQYVTTHEREHYTDNGEALREELWVFFFNSFLSESRPSFIIPFMDFHLHECYDKRDFLAFVRMSPNLMPYMYVDEYKLYFKDQFLAQANEWVESKRKLVERMREEESGSLVVTRIKVIREGEAEPVSIWEIEAFFMKRLARPRKIGDKVKIMEEDEVRDFVHANFFGSPHPVDRRRFKTRGIQKDIMEAVYEFYCTVDTGTKSTRAYCHLLVSVFEEFNSYVINLEAEEYDLKKLSGNFSRYVF